MLPIIPAKALKCRTLGVYNARARMLAGKARAIETQALYTAGSAIALTGAIRMLVLPHGVTAGASLYIEQEYLIAGKPE